MRDQPKVTEFPRIGHEGNLSAHSSYTSICGAEFFTLFIIFPKANHRALKPSQGFPTGYICLLSSRVDRTGN